MADLPARRFTDTAVGATTLGTLHIRGSISGTDCVRIGGNVEGPIELDGLLHIAEGGRVTGPVTARGAVIDGELQGRLVARERVELSATARVRADIHAGTVAIAEGCFFDGRIHMGGGEPGAPGGPTTFREKRRRRGRGHGAEAAARPEHAAPVTAPPPVAPALPTTSVADAAPAAAAGAPPADPAKGAPPRPTV